MVKMRKVSCKLMAMVCALALCVSMLGTALAQPEPINEPRCKPEEVDLSDVREENGRLVGVLHLPESPYLFGEVRIDCLIPEAFPAEKAQTLNVAYKSMGKKGLAAAMKAVGQSTKAGELHEWSDKDQFFVNYSLWEMNAEPWVFADHHMINASFYDDPAHTDTYSQAKDITQALLSQLGATVYEPLLHANRYDAEHAVSAGRFACYSNADGQYQEALARFRQNAKKFKHTEGGMTMVSGLYELYGLPVMASYSYMDGGDRMGASSEFHAIVGDDGELRLFELWGLPTVESTKPLTLPTHTWQEAIARVACGWWLGNPCAETQECTDYLTGEQYTCYPIYAVITEIRPCWIGYERGKLVPGYYMNVEERMVDGDKLISVWSSYGDAETLTLVH